MPVACSLGGTGCVSTVFLGLNNIEQNQETDFNGCFDTFICSLCQCFTAPGVDV